MKFDSNIEKCLTGEVFTDPVNVKIAERESKVLYRLDYLEALSKDKKIIHFGCCDHLNIIPTKIKNNTWLHKRLCDKSSLCLGIDNNKEGIEQMIQLGYAPAVCLDILKDEVPEEIKKQKWDYLLMGETLEHIDNPVLFLSTLKEKYAPYVNEIIITVPSAFRYKNIKYIFKNLEYNNSDHRYWFTPYTLGKVMTAAGYKINYFQLVNSYYLTPFSIITKFLLTRFPALRETIVMVAKF